MYGAKLGYFFPTLNWLGVETEVFNTNPNQKQQGFTVTVPGRSASGVVSGTFIRVTTWAFNLIARYPGEQFQPYAGAGFGVFFANAGGDSDTAVGLNALAGARFFLTNHVAVFGEYKYNRATFTFTENVPGFGPAGLKGDYATNILAAGVSFHF